MTADVSPVHRDAARSPAGAVTELPSLLFMVPHDPWFRIRVAAMATCAAAYLWWSRTQGLITDRISGIAAVGVFLVCAFIGTPWRRWAQVVVDATCYVGMWFVYESTRGAADGLGMPLQMEVWRGIDRAMFFGLQPTEWAQRHWYQPGVVRWYDQVLSLVYYSHFVVPVIAIAGVWAVGRVVWVRYMRRFATLVVAGCVMFVVLPSVPPWMASDERFGFGVGEPLARHVRRGALELGFTGFAHDWGVTLDWSNVVAAMPSLHAAFSLFVVVFFLPMIRRRWLQVLAFAYPLTMAVALVYFAEHWVIDIVVGWGVVAGSFAVWHRLERRWRERDVAAVLAALPATGYVVPSADDPGSTAARGSIRAVRSTPCRNPAMVLLDRSFLRDLASVDSTSDPADSPTFDSPAVESPTLESPTLESPTVDRYRRLLARHLDDEIRLAARQDHLAEFAPTAHRGLLAAVRPVHVASQYRRQAHRLARLGRFAALADRPEELITLVVARRTGAAELVVGNR